MPDDYALPIDEISCTTGLVPESIYQANTPVVLRGLVSNWPIVKQAKQSNQNVVDYLKHYYNKKPVNAFMAAPEAEARIFYNETVDGFNFVQANVHLDEVLDKLVEISSLDNQPTYYVGSLEVNQHLPGFSDKNELHILNNNVRTGIWIGNKSRIAPHYDFPDNIACCVAGQRRFTLFPPEQQKNLYVGPLDFTPAGQAISMVDINSPDLTRYPRFELAMKAAKTTVLDAGDAIYIPSMWWHSVESLSSLNGLVNYWYRDTPSYLGDPSTALLHAIMSIKQLPDRQRKAWQNIFNDYVFEQAEDMYEHLPQQVKENQSKVSELTARKIRAQLMNKLK